MEGPDSSTKAVIQEGAPFWTKAQMSVEGRTVHHRIINIHGGNPGAAIAPQSAWKTRKRRRS